MEKITICIECKHCLLYGLSFYYCEKSPIANPRINFTTGEIHIWDKYKLCNQVNLDGNCPLFEESKKYENKIIDFFRKYFRKTKG